MTSAICYPDSTDWSCVPQTTVDELDPEMKERAEALAWSTLAGLTGHFFSTCPITVRPCRKTCAPGWRSWAPVPAYSGGSFQPHIDPAGYWVNSCMCASDPCSCGPIHEIVLPGPVGSIVEVLIDGAVLHPSAYRVDNGNRLVRQDGADWPACQDMNKPGGPVYEPVIIENLSNTMTVTREGQLVQIVVEPTEPPQGGMFAGTLPYVVRGGSQTNVYDEAGVNVGVFVLGGGTADIGGSSGPGFVPFRIVYETTDAPASPDMTSTFSVEYYRGTGPNTMLDYAAGVLAWEFYQACSGNDCRLPAGVTSVSRQGVSFQIATGMFANGMTGIREVDAIIGIYNPNGLKAPPYVSSPDLKPGRVTTYGGR